MAIKISGAGLSGNNDERTAERSGRSGRVIQPLWNIVANAAIRTGPHIPGPARGRRAPRPPGPPPGRISQALRAGDERRPERRGRERTKAARAFLHSRVEWDVE